MNFIIKMMDNSIVRITEEEFAKLKGKEGLIFIPSVCQTINLNSVVRILPEKIYLEEMDRKDQREGILHDGTRVIRYFGSWYLDGFLGDNGKPQKVIDPQYYPEVARDCVPTPKEFYDKYEMLPQKERLRLIIGERKESQKVEFEKIDFKLLK